MVKAKGLATLSALSLMAVSAASHAALSSYQDDFSGYGGLSTMGASSGKTWGGFSDNCGFPGGYGFEPSTAGPQISAIANDGTNDFWNVYGNYDNAVCQNGGGPNVGQGENISVFQQQTFSAAEAAGGDTWTFEFLYREADLGPTGSTTVGAFIRVFDNFFNLLDEQTLDTSGGIPGGAFNTGSLSQTLSALWVDGGIIQFGYNNQVINFEGSGMNYDNVCWNNTGGSCDFGAPIPVPAAVWLFGSALGLLGWTRRRMAS